MAKLSDTKLRGLSPRENPYQVADGEGLYIEVLPSGAKSFRYGYRLLGKKEKVVLGTYPALSLAAARQLHRKYQTMVEHDQSPARHVQEQRREKKAEYLGTNSLEAHAREWLASWCIGKSPQAASQATAWLEADVFPTLGKQPINQIDEMQLVAFLDQIKARAPQTARRILGYLKGIFHHARRRGIVKYSPAQSITGDEIAPKSERDRTLEPAEITNFIRALEGSTSTEGNRLALKLILLTLCRKDELRLAQWPHINFEAAEWLMPRTKMGKPHVVYLSEQALSILRRLKELAGESVFVLPHRDRPTKPIGHMTLNKIIDNLLKGPMVGTERFTVHDLRRTASTRLHEAGFAPDVVEKALGHRMQGVRGIYNRAEYADQRREMLQFWANYLDGLASGNVVQGNFAKAA
jgi:integrase